MLEREDGDAPAVMILPNLAKGETIRACTAILGNPDGENAPPDLDRLWLVAARIIGLRSRDALFAPRLRHSSAAFHYARRAATYRRAFRFIRREHNGRGIINWLTAWITRKRLERERGAAQDREGMAPAATGTDLRGDSAGEGC